MLLCLSIDAALEDPSSQRSHGAHTVRRPVRPVPTAGEALGVRDHGAATGASVQRRCSDGPSGPVASRDTHLPPTVRGADGHSGGRRHDPGSSYPGSGSHR
jgi:hypothetical protein